MGMYDYLGDYQVKIFNIPIYYGEHFGSGFMGGKLSLYNKGENLPERFKHKRMGMSTL